MNGMTKLRVCVMSVGFGVALMFAPSAHAQAESSPDHFTETGVEIGPGGNVPQYGAHASAKQQAKPVTHAAAPARSTAAPVHVAMVVADKKRPAVVTSQKR